MCTAGADAANNGDAGSEREEVGESASGSSSLTRALIDPEGCDTEEGASEGCDIDIVVGDREGCESVRDGWDSDRDG